VRIWLPLAMKAICIACYVMLQSPYKKPRGYAGARGNGQGGHTLQRPQCYHNARRLSGVGGHYVSATSNKFALTLLQRRDWSPPAATFINFILADSFPSTRHFCSALHS